MTLIETARLRLRQMNRADAPFILELLNDPAFIRFIADRGVRTIADAEQYIINGPLTSYQRNGFGLYIVELKVNGTPIGMCGLIRRDGLEDVDIGYALLERFRAQGYASEAAAAVLDYGRDTVGLKRIVAITSVDNDNSINVLKKLGFKFEKLVTLPGSEEEINLFGMNFA